MKHRLASLLALVPVLAALLAAPGTARAASRLVVVPVVVGGGGEPDAALLGALAEGLKQNPQWGVEQGDALVTLAKFETSSVPDADLARLTGAVDDAAKKLGGSTSAADEAASALATVREELRAAARKGPRGAAANDLAWRASTLLIAAYLAAKEEAKARTAAEEAALLFPGRKLVAEGKISAKAVELFNATRPGLGARVTLRTRPEGCEILAGDVVLGKDPLELSVLQGDAYYFRARCAPVAAPVTVAPAAGTPPAPVVSFPKKVLVPESETARQDVLDAEFERGFVAEGMRRVRFASTPERRQLEESYARRVAERFDADSVVFASVGELSGADWLNARLFTRSGYLNRQGLVRLEAQRANALGRFLATGKDVPGVLKPEEAGALLASARVSSERPEPTVSPWYTDAVGWSLLGAGIVTFGFGQWGQSTFERKQEEADSTRDPNSDKQDRLYREAQTAKFWGGIGRVGGLLFMATGIVLLAVPEYSDDESFLALRPTWLPGGGALTLGGKF